MHQPKTVFIAGHSRLPQGMAAKSVFETLTVSAEIEVKYGVIIQASCTLATEQGSNFVGSVLKGHSLNEGIDEVTEALQSRYRGKATNALVAAIKDLELQFKTLREKLAEED